MGSAPTYAPVSGLTYDDLCRWYPDEDGYRRELIDGELYVSPAPSARHQTVVVELIAALVVVHDLSDGSYGDPRVLRHGDTLTAPTADGFRTTVQAVLVAG